MEGFDCSGYVIEILKSIGHLPREGDWTAAGLWEHFRNLEVSYPQRGCLVFYENKSRTRIVHVEFCLDAELAIGASGGGSRTGTIRKAVDNNAYIKVRPIESRPHIRGYINTFNMTE